MDHLTETHITELRAELKRQLVKLEKSMTVTDEALKTVELDQGAAEIFRVQKQDGFIVSTVPRFAIPQDACARRDELIAGADDIVDFVTQVMGAPVGITLEELRDRRILAQWVQELYFRIRKLDEYGGNTVRRQVHGFCYLSTERITIHGRGRFKIRNDDCDVVQFTYHVFLLP